MKFASSFLRITFTTLSLLSAGVVAGASPVINGEALTSTEVLLLTPVCRLILVDRPGAHINENAKRLNADVLARPEFQMARNSIHLHHWCWATVAKTRYMRTNSSTAKFHYQSTFHSDMDYVIRNMNADWEYMPQMHTEKGEMYFTQKDYVGALNETVKALKQTPNYVKAHALQAKAFIALGQNENALVAATEGLRHDPLSRVLKRLYDETGGKPPYPTPYVKSQENAAESPTSSETLLTEPTPAPEIEKSRTPEPLPPSTSTPDGNPKDNPYCRFCPVTN